MSMFGGFRIVWIWFSCYRNCAPPHTKKNSTPPLIPQRSTNFPSTGAKKMNANECLYSLWYMLWRDMNTRARCSAHLCPRWERSTGEVNWAWKLIFQRQQRSRQNCLSPRGLQQKVNTMEHKTVSTPRDFLFNSFHCYRYFAAFHSLFSLLFFSSGVYYIRRLRRHFLLLE